jgi:hypothetical protein
MLSAADFGSYGCSRRFGENASSEFELICEALPKMLILLIIEETHDLFKYPKHGRNYLRH